MQLKNFKSKLDEYDNADVDEEALVNDYIYKLDQ